MGVHARERYRAVLPGRSGGAPPAAGTACAGRGRSPPPRFHPNSHLIAGVVCGVRVEEVADPTMRKLRYLDLLIDQLAKGKAMEKILPAG